MGLAVGSYQSCPVHPQHHVQVVQGHIVQQHVITPLQEAGIHCKHRHHALLGHTGAHGHPVALGNAHIEKALGQGVGKLRQPRAVHHGGGNGADPVVLLGQVQQLMAKHGGKALPRRFQGLSGLHIEGAHAVVLPRLLLGVGVSLSLDGVHVQQHRPAHIQGQHQHLGQGLHIVAVHGTHIGKAHVFKHRAAGQQGFFQGRFHIVAHGVHPLAGLAAGEHLAIAPLELVILRRAAQPGQVPGQAAHVGVDGHAVVVEDHDQRLAAGSGVVEPLEAQTAAHGTVADQGQHMIVLPLQGPGPGHAQGHRHGVGGMTGDKCVVDALPGLGEAGQAPELPQGIEQLPPPGQGLVDIALVAHVEHQPVHGGVEHPVDGHGKLHHPQIGGQVAAGPGYLPHQEIPQLRTELPGLIFIEPLHIGGAVHMV